MKIQLTDEEFRLIAPSVGPARRAELLPRLQEAMDRFRVSDSKFRVAAFLSNLLQESAGLTRFVESLDYSAERLCQVWPARFPDLKSAQPFAHNERALAARVYGGRLGNKSDLDAFLFRGHGGIQRTGRSAYERAEAALGIPCVSDPDLLARPEYSFLSDALFWSDKVLNALADCLRGKRDAAEARTLAAICRRVNGGTTGLAERVQFYWRCLAILDRAPSAQSAAWILDSRIAASPLIPTPETHDAIQQKIVSKSAVLQAQAEAAHVDEQTRAAHYIDLAERTPAGVIALESRSLWEKFGPRAVEALAWLGAGLRAGEVSAYLLSAVVVTFLAYLAYRNRADLRRWAVVALSAAKEAALGS